MPNICRLTTRTWYVSRPTSLQTHASELSAAGFTFIAPDATNWDGDPRNTSNGADFNQLRPTEIIAEGACAALHLPLLRLPATSSLGRIPCPIYPSPFPFPLVEWANMRIRGEATPQLSTYDQVNEGGVLYNWYLSEARLEAEKGYGG